MSAAEALTSGISSNPDLDLADRHRYGDATAFEEIYERFAPMVYNLCLRLCGNSCRAQDLSQEIFLRVFKGLKRFRGRSSLRTWIYRIALNHCRSRLGRKKLLLEELSTEIEEGALPDPSRGPEERLMASECGRRVAGALVQLPRCFREAVVLRDIEGLSYDEIATVLGVRVGTVRSRIARGRDRLRIVLEASA